MKLTSNQAGFTLPELIIAVTLLAILAGFTVQGWSTLVHNSRHRTLLNDYQSLFAYARWTAASSNQLITVCPLSTQNRCGDNWAAPVTVFVDENNDKRPDDDDSVLRVFQAELGRFSIHSRTGGRGYFQFNERGMTHGAMGGLVLCAPTPTLGTMTYMAVNIAGRFRAEHDDNADGVIRLRWGATIRC